eukprot:3938186-Rhodomonas_salina.3
MAKRRGESGGAQHLELHVRALLAHARDDPARDLPLTQSCTLCATSTAQCVPLVLHTITARDVPAQYRDCVVVNLDWNTQTGPYAMCVPDIT